MSEAGPILSLLGLLLLLALPFALPVLFVPLPHGSRRWSRFLRAIPMSIVAAVIPLAVFALSAILLPSWKGAARCGWVEGFHYGKYALTPLVLFATAALHRLEVTGLGASRPRWVALGLFCGVVASVLCQAFAYACTSMDGALRWIWVALWYVPLWYGVRAAQCGLRTQLGAIHYLGASVAMLPFWIGSWFWSKSAFQALPDVAPEECFVVTASGRGHPSLVGPFFTLERRGVQRRVNGQLRAFWRLEAQWQATSPRTHRQFRELYNRLGPAVAARITSPWRADLLFLALKPLEYLARAASRL